MVSSPFRKDQLSPEMQERYGFNQRNHLRTAVIALVTVIFAVGVGFATFSMSQKSIQFKLLTWSVVSPERTDLQFEVRRIGSDSLDGVVRAQDSKRVDVGYSVITIPSGNDLEEVNYSLRTLAPAFVVEVLTCVKSGEPTRVPGPQFPAGISPPPQPWMPVSSG
jgi:hypothetical protein